MQVPSTQTSTQTNTQNNAPAPQSSGTAGVSLDYNAFLRLLIAQMKNQDPTNPTDPSQWMGQIASFSNVEQSIQANAKLDSMMTSMRLTQVDSLIGHTITTADGKVSGKIASVQIYTDGSIATLEDGTKLLLSEGVSIS